MLGRWLFVLSLATILVGRTLHCCYVDSVLCAAPVRGAQPGNLPLGNPDDLDPNETGCICKGTIPTPDVFEAVRPGLDQFNPLAFPIEAGQRVVLDGSPAGHPLDRHLLGPPPLGGKALRAWIGSLLI